MSDISLFPSNRTKLEDTLEQVINVAFDTTMQIATLWNPDTCPLHLLPWLASAMSVDFWDEKWSEETKRRVIRASVEVHRNKGTVGSIKRALWAAGYGKIEVIERYGWETYNGAYKYDGSIAYAAPDLWFEYRIKLTRPITIEQAAQVREILSTVAPVRCRLKALEFPEALNIYDNSIRYNGIYTHGVA